MGSPKRDQQANTHMEMGYAWRLATLVGALPKKDQSFVVSMVKQFDTKGKLSDKQWYWVGKKLRLANSIGVGKGYVEETIEPDGSSYEIKVQPETLPAFMNPKKLKMPEGEETATGQLDELSAEDLEKVCGPSPKIVDYESDFMAMDYGQVETAVMAHMAMDLKEFEKVIDKAVKHMAEELKTVAKDTGKISDAFKNWGAVVQGLKTPLSSGKK